MKVRLFPWGGSLLLHTLVIGGIMLISNRLHQPLQIELFDFALLPNVQSINNEAINTETKPTPPPPQVKKVPPKPPTAQPVRPKPKPAVTAEPAVVKTVEPALQVEPPGEVPLPPNEVPLQPSEAFVNPTATEELPASTVESPTALQRESAQATAPASRPATTVAPADKQERYLAAQFSYIRDKVLATLTYPTMARRMGWTGQVKISFLILENGDVEEVVIEESSGHTVLDRAAVQAVKKAAPFPSPPVAANITLPVTFRLQ